ncbi:hypothetical protein [Xenorhabdus kozodoii]|uniref:Uncharacterized protein n=1 Tax=Xenorhabdus kozodoii TaxID=351676 RepID=A0A2D0LEX4_9GAMM|nr:hypothetical protein [Xenorhabdus kozodoii]PHM74163.1 hypothetical protein Xkoz_01048 [Xenorhabdus kozodoii]
MNKIKENKQPLPWHGVSKLEIKLRQISHGANIFANGRHRVVVDVYIQGTDAKGDKILVPRDVLFLHTVLIDYNTGEPLTWQAGINDDFTWSYTDEPNEFTIKQELSSTNNNVEEYDSYNLSMVSFYIYCSPETANGFKQVAALVTAPDGNEYSSAYGKDYDSFIQLNSISEINYKYEELGIEKDSRPIAEHIAVTHNGSDIGWEQYNTYVTLKPNYLYDKDGKRYILKYDCFFRQTNEPAPVDTVHQLLHDAYSSIYLTFYYAHFLWSMGEKKTVSVGQTNWFGLHIDQDIHIEIRQKSNAICFTVISTSHYHHPIVQEDLLDLYIILYDQYGNTGAFSIESNYKNDFEKYEIHLKNYNP